MKFGFPRSIKIGPLWISLVFQSWKIRYLMGDFYGIFRNRQSVNGGRWGFYFLGIEFGSRNPGNRFGLLLAKLGLWRW